MSSKLVSGNKERLLGEFRRLKEIKGRQWRKLLIQYNPWHNSIEGLYAWQNAGKGTVGNESLRAIVSDMSAIVDNKRRNNKLRKAQSEKDHVQVVAEDSLKALGFSGLNKSRKLSTRRLKSLTSNHS